MLAQGGRVTAPFPIGNSTRRKSCRSAVEQTSDTDVPEHLLCTLLSRALSATLSIHFIVPSFECSFHGNHGYWQLLPFVCRVSSRCIHLYGDAQHRFLASRDAWALRRAHDPLRPSHRRVASGGDSRCYSPAMPHVPLQAHLDCDKRRLPRLPQSRMRRGPPSHNSKSWRILV